MSNLKRKLYINFARKFNKTETEQVPVPSIVSNNTKVNGNISSKGIIHIDGIVEGDVTCDELIIGIKGAVIGSVNVNDLQIYGTLQGKAVVNDLFIAKTARLIGDAKHQTIAIEPGAYIDGHCTHAANEETKKVDVAQTTTEKNKK